MCGCVCDGVGLLVHLLSKMGSGVGKMCASLATLHWVQMLSVGWVGEGISGGICLPICTTEVTSISGTVGARDAGEDGDLLRTGVDPVVHGGGLVLLVVVVLDVL